MSAAAEAAKAAAAATAHPGLSPDFLMYMQMQEQKDARNEAICREDLARMEALRKEDLERASQERYAQQKLHEQQMQLLTKQLKNATKISSSVKSTSKMPLFDIDKDTENFHIWQNRWKLHVQGHGFNNISNAEERNTRILMELTASLTDSTLAWLASKTFNESELSDHKFIIKAIEDKIQRQSNPLVHQIELLQMSQHAHESADSLIQRVQEKATKCQFQSIKNFVDHQSMVTLIKAVRPEVRRKMLLQKVKSFEEACDILKNEEQASEDTQKCSQARSQVQEAEGNAISVYKRDQRSQHNEKFASQKLQRESLQNFKPFCCIRCHSKDHLAHDCPALLQNKTCNKCQKVGHFSYACLNKSRPRRHSDSNDRPHAESHSVTAIASAVTAFVPDAGTVWGHDPDWVKSLIDRQIEADADEFGSLG